MGLHDRPKVIETPRWIELWLEEIDRLHELGAPKEEAWDRATAAIEGCRRRFKRACWWWYFWSPLPYLGFGFRYRFKDHLLRPSQENWILFLGPFALRLHKFHPGAPEADNPHDHPFCFITFPLVGYEEVVFKKGGTCDRRIVRPWRFHFRSYSYTHVFVFPKLRCVYTLVLTFGQRF
jgi:hypothetical protein